MEVRYTARDPIGKIREGTLEADTVDEATQKLRRDGYQIIEIEEGDAPIDLIPRRVSKQELIYVTSQLAIMVDTGITLSAALGGILDQETNPALRKVLTSLRDAVEAGEDFSAVLARHPHLFDKTYCAMVKASEATGSMGTMLDRIAAYLQKRAETQAKIRGAMAYPAVMMVMAVGVTVFLLTYVLPKFLPLFKSRGTELPMPTKIVMRASDVIMGYWYLWAGLAVVGVIGFILARRTQWGRQAIDWLKLNTPIIGPMIRKVIISRSIYTLGTMLASGVSIMEAIQLAGEVSSNVFYERIWNRVLEEVATGKRICEVLRGQPLFPKVLVQMIASGEETGKLDQVLERVSVYYDREVETAVKAATSLIEPLMISVMGVVVGTIGLALMLPIFSLSRQP